MKIIHFILIIFANSYFVYCSIELTLETFITSALSSNDFVKNVNTAFYWSKNIYRLIKDFKSLNGNTKPDLNAVKRELTTLEKNMQASLKETKQILLDHHFQTHIELPTFALYRHVTTYISNPTKISENELIEACSKRYSPNDILSNLSVLLQKQWILNKLKETEFDKDTVDGIEVFIENLIKQLIIAQSFCVELRYSNNNSDNKSYRGLTVKFVEEIRSLIMKQVKSLKKSLNNPKPQPCTHKKEKNKKSVETSSILMAVKSPYYLLIFVFNLLYALINDIFYLFYYLFYYIFTVIKFLILGIYNLIVYILLSIQYLLISFKDLVILISSYCISIVSASLSYLYNLVSFISYHTLDLILWSFKPLIVSVIVTAAYDEFCGEQRLRNLLEF